MRRLAAAIAPSVPLLAGAVHAPVVDGGVPADVRAWLASGPDGGGDFSP